MTSTEMAAMMLQEIRRLKGGVTFVELMRPFGDAARGTLAFEFPTVPNCILWAGVSNTFFDAFAVARYSMEVHGTNILVYVADGAGLTLPLARRLRTNVGYKKPHWLPVVFSIIKDTVFQKKIEDGDIPAENVAPATAVRAAAFPEGIQ